MRRVLAVRLSYLLVTAVTMITFGISLSGSVSAYGSHRHRLSYVALGDSVAAGLGLPQAATASPEDKTCGRSVQAYPQVLAGMAGGWLTVKNLACSGAGTANFANSQLLGGVNIQPQLDAAFASGKPDALSLTVGANDAHWADFIGVCYVSTCDTATNTAALEAYIGAFKTNLADVFTDIKNRSHGRAPLTVVTGYYSPMSAACAVAGSPITTTEAAWVGDQTTKLNAVIKQAAEQSGYAAYAPVDFTGHDVCSADSWLQRPGIPGETNPFHPNKTGQEQIAKAILQTLLP